MKRADIEIGKEYAVRDGRRVLRAVCVDANAFYPRFRWHQNGTDSISGFTLPQVLMPWPQWLEQQEANKARTRDIDRQRQEHDALSFVELRARLATYGVAIREWNEELRLVTLRVEDLARLLSL